MRGHTVVMLAAAGVAAVALVLGARGVLTAPGSALPWSAPAGGGGLSSSTNYDLGATAGQSAPIGETQSTNYHLSAGYWYGAGLDTDGDGRFDRLDPDDDGDGYWDGDETNKGSLTLDYDSTPEHCDGVDNDGDTTLDEAPAGSGRATPDPLCDPGADPDGDTIANAADPDDDGDGYSDVAEQYMTTDELDDCPNHTAHDAWPPDVDRSGTVDVVDAILFGPVVLSSPGDPEYDARMNLGAASGIDIVDVLMLGPVILESCGSP